MRIAYAALLVMLLASPAMSQETPPTLPPGISDMMVRDLGRERADALMHRDTDAEGAAAASWLMRWVDANRAGRAGPLVPPQAVGPGR